MLIVPTARKLPMKRNYQEDEWDNFVANDKIINFESVNEALCPKGFTFTKHQSFVIMYKLIDLLISLL